MFSLQTNSNVRIAKDVHEYDRYCACIACFMDVKYSSRSSPKEANASATYDISLSNSGTQEYFNSNHQQILCNDTSSNDKSIASQKIDHSKFIITSTGIKLTKGLKLIQLRKLLQQLPTTEQMTESQLKEYRKINELIKHRQCVNKLANGKYTSLYRRINDKVKEFGEDSLDERERDIYQKYQNILAVNRQRRLNNRDQKLNILKRKLNSLKGKV